MTAHRYEIVYVSNGREGRRFELALSPEEALEKARSSWTDYGDESPEGMWIAGAWAVQ